MDSKPKANKLTELLLPRWTKRAFIESGGRDPLGLSRVADIIKSFLLTGINSNNNRARYYSFYCWVLWHIAQTEDLKSYENFVSAFRRREATTALATLTHNNNASFVGVDATKIYFGNGQIEDEYDCDFKVLPSRRLGGYEQFYSGSLFYLGLYHRPEGEYDQVTEGTAEELAILFHSSIEKTPYIKKKLYTEKKISCTDLHKSAQSLTLDALQYDFTKAEREKLIEIFFGFNQKIPNDETFLRRHTLTLLLHMIAEREDGGIGAIAKHGRLDEDLLYVFYYGAVWIDNEENEITIPYQKPTGFSFCLEMWRQFCLQQFLAQSLELLLCSILDILGRDSNGLTTDELIAELLNTEFFKEIGSIIGQNCQKPSELLAALDITDIPDDTKSRELQTRLLQTHPLSEAKLLYYESSNASVLAAHGVLLLAVLYGKWRGMYSDSAFSYLHNRAGQELWIDSVLPYLDLWIDEKTSWETALKNIIEEFILNQHDRIMYEKGKLESCWIERREGKVFKSQDYKVLWRSSRHSSAIYIMRDLGLVRINEANEISLTAKGKRVMEKSLKYSHGETQFDN